MIEHCDVITIREDRAEWEKLVHDARDFPQPPSNAEYTEWVATKALGLQRSLSLRSFGERRTCHVHEALRHLAQLRSSFAALGEDDDTDSALLSARHPVHVVPG